MEPNRSDKITPYGVLALDLALTTGWAHSNGVSGTHVYKPRRGDSPGMRWLDFRSWLNQLLDLTPTNLIVYEQAGHHRSNAATHSAHGFISQVEAIVAERKGLDLTSRSPTDLKNYILPDVHHKKRKKGRMIQFVENSWPHIRLADDNEADAVCLLWYVLNDLEIKGTEWHRRRVV